MCHQLSIACTSNNFCSSTLSPVVQITTHIAKAAQMPITDPQATYSSQIPGAKAILALASLCSLPCQHPNPGTVHCTAVTQCNSRQPELPSRSLPSKPTPKATAAHQHTMHRPSPSCSRLRVDNTLGGASPTPSRSISAQLGQRRV